MDGYTLYGDLAARDTLALATTLVAKGLPVAHVPESASLSLALAARAGSVTGPYLRTPDGFVLADLHATLEWLERMHPTPPLMPASPARRTCARILEAWVELWLPLWPRRSWATLDRIGIHLEAAGFLLGDAPCRADWMLAAWLETEVLVHDHAREHLARHAPRLTFLGDDLLAASPRESADDVIPISLLPVLSEVALDYHGYLVENQKAIKDQSDRVVVDLGLGRRGMPVRVGCEQRRAEIGRELSALDQTGRRDLRQLLEPVAAWHALTLPPVVSEIDPADPRSL